MFWKRKPPTVGTAAQRALSTLLEQKLNRSLKPHKARDLRVTLQQLENLEISLGESHVVVLEDPLFESLKLVHPGLKAEPATDDWEVLRVVNV